MVEIIPAVLPKSFKDLEGHLARISGACKLVQVDVVDGHFAHNRTWPYKDSGTFEKIAEEERGLPFWGEFDYQFDLMIQNPLERVMDFVHAGASQIVLHSKSQGAQDALQKLADIRERDDIGPFTVKVGIAIACDDQPDVLEPFEAQFDFVQVMGIARVGFQGEPFDKRALYLTERLRRRYTELPLQIDGAVSKENARALVLAGATRLVIGHDVWDAEDPKEEIEQLLQIAAN